MPLPATSPGLPPYSHLATVVAVADDPQFLRSLAFQVDRNHACTAFTDPWAALAFLRDRLSEQPRAEAFLSPLQAVDMVDLPGDIDDRGMRVHCSQIVGLAGDPDRSRTVFGLIVDYDMPGLNGLDLCRRLGPTPIRRILLTGEADDRAAIDAFNEGVIDCAIRKGDGLAMQRIRGAIANAHRCYFQVKTALVTRILAASGGFLQDPAVCAHVEEVLRGFGIAEHFLTVDPPGLLCLTPAADGFLLLIQSTIQVENHHHTAREFPGPMIDVENDATESPRQPLLLIEESDLVLPSLRWALYPAVRLGDHGEWWVSRIAIPPDLCRVIRRVARHQRFTFG